MAEQLSIEAAEQKLFGPDPAPAGEQAPPEPKRIPAWREQQRIARELITASVEGEKRQAQLRDVQSQIEELKARHNYTDADVEQFARDVEAAQAGGASA